MAKLIRALKTTANGFHWQIASSKEEIPPFCEMSMDLAKTTKFNAVSGILSMYGVANRS